MKKQLFLVSMTMVFASLLWSCGGNSAGSTFNADGDAVSVDRLLADAGSHVGDTVVIEGVCSHLCRHGGRKAFVVGSADSVMIRCEAFPLMGEPFPKSAIRQPIQVKGVVCEERIDEAAVSEMIRQHEELQKATAESAAATGEDVREAESGCDTERAAKGQKGLNSFDERIADYRVRIAARQAKEGKPYLSFYYLQAISYETLEE